MKTIFKIITRTIACILFVPAFFIPMVLWFFGVLPLIYISTPIYFICTGEFILNQKFVVNVLDPEWVAFPAFWIFNKLK